MPACRAPILTRRQGTATLQRIVVGYKVNLTEIKSPLREENYREWV